MRRGRFPIAAFAVVLVGMVFAGSTHACSCLRSTPAESLERADAAVVGRLLGVDPQGPGRAVYRYEVKRVFRGQNAIEPGSTLRVAGSRGGAACGLPERTGARFGLFLAREHRRWTGSLCGVVSPRQLRDAAEKPRERKASGSKADCAG